MDTTLVYLFVYLLLNSLGPLSIGSVRMGRVSSSLEREGGQSLEREEILRGAAPVLFTSVTNDSSIAPQLGWDFMSSSVIRARRLADMGLCMQPPLQ